jgi:hypothetical protein
VSNFPLARKPLIQRDRRKCEKIPQRSTGGIFQQLS